VTATEEVRERFLSLWSRLGPMWGIPPSTARLHAWLLARPEGADAETLSAELELSRGAVSMA
jgi:DNA-binding transcriptional regulator GbsR (MarR family)